MAACQKLLTDEEEVIAANRTFYAALHTLDMSLMAQVGLHEDGVKCLHPEWDLLIGWDEVQRRGGQVLATALSRPMT
jgi:hypothetical protein